MLATELGIEPGAELRALEQAVLRQEVPAPPPVARHSLPVRLTSFVGREEDLAGRAVFLRSRRPPVGRAERAEPATVAIVLRSRCQPSLIINSRGGE
jgi:hypothetical protein